MRLKRFIYLLNYANLYICFLLKKPKVLYHISIRLLAFTFYLLSCRSAIYKFNRATGNNHVFGMDHDEIYYHDNDIEDDED